MRDLAYDFVENACKIEWKDIPPDVVDVTKKFILDTFGTLLAGSTAPGCKTVVELVKELSGKEESTVLVYGGKVPAPNAAFVNSVMAHARDFDDTHDKAVLHANVSVLPAALSAAECTGGISGKKLITAVTLGIDVMCRLGLGLRGIRNWILSSTLGYFGATIAVSKILGLDEEKMLNALGIVYSQVAGNIQCLTDGGLVKRMQPAFAAKAAVFSSILAEKGITGAKNIFEGKHGFFITYENGEYNREVIIKNLGKHFEGINLSMKFYPCCRATHPALDGVLELVKKYDIKPENIDRVFVHVTPLVYDLVGRQFEIRASPQVDAQFSIPYTVSTAIFKRDVFIDDFEDDRVTSNREIHKFTKRVEVIPDQRPTEKGGLVPCKVEIRTKDGKLYSEEVKIIRGDPRGEIKIQDVIEKFIKCAKFSAKPIEVNRLEEIVYVIKNLEKVKNINELIELFI